MSDEMDQIRMFLEQMKEEHREQIEAVQLPEGTVEHVNSLIEEGDVDTIIFMLKLGYLMGLQAGFAIAHGDGEDADGERRSGPFGPLEA